MALDERELARQLRAGASEGFAALYDHYAPRVMGFALRLTGSRPEAEDLVQEVFLAAYRGRAGFQGRSGLIVWLLGIAARRWRDLRRCRRLETVPTPGEPEGDIAEALKTEDMAPQVVRTLMLTEALDELEQPFREALLLVASQGLTYREAAEALGEPVGTVKWRVSVAVRRMRVLLREEPEGRAVGECRRAGRSQNELHSRPSR